MEMKPYEVYIQTNENGYIVAVNSSDFLTDTSGWVKIDEGYGDRFHHAQNNYFEGPIYTDGGACRYKLEKGEVQKCTEKEIAAQEAANQPEQPAPNEYEARIAALEEQLAAAKILLGVE